MKKKVIILGVAVASLTIGSIAISGLFSNRNAKEVDAATIPNGQLYVQVKNTNDLRVGDTVIFGADYYNEDVMFTYLAGNPIFATGETMSGHNNDNSKYYFSSSDVIPWVIENGVANNTYSFKSIKNKSLEKNMSHPTNGRYLAYGHNYSGPNYSHIQAYGDVNTSGSKNNDSSWTVKFDSSGFAHVQRYGEPYQWSEGAETFTEIRYHGGISRDNFGYYQEGGMFKIFRKVNLSYSYSINVTKLPDKVNYVFGEDSDLTGLEMTITFNDDGRQESPAYSPITCTYANEPDFFTASAVSIARSEGGFLWCGLKCGFEATVTQDTSQERQYEKANYRLYDPRGTFVLGFDYQLETSADIYTDNTFVVNINALTSSPGQLNYLPIWGIQNPISDTNYPLGDQQPQKVTAVTNNVVDIVLEEVDDGYGADKYTFIKTGSDYLFNTGEGNFKKGSISGGGLSIISTAAMDLDENNHIRFGYGQGILVFNKTNEKIEVADYTYEYQGHESDYIPIELYRLKMTPNLNLAEKMDEFKETFFELMSDFDSTGVTRDLNKNDWNLLKEDFGKLNDNIKGLLASLTYTHNEEEGGSIEQLLDMYESIVVIYYDLDGFDDFMDRDRSHHFISNPRRVTVNPVNCHITDNYIVGSYRYENVTVFEPNQGFDYPDYVEVLMGGQPLRENGYTYTKATGTITIHDHVIVDDITINIECVFKDSEEITETLTIAALTYDYQINQNSEYVFTNLAIRFGGLVSKETWDRIDDTLDILGFGVMIATSDLDGEKLDETNALHNMFIDDVDNPNLASDSTKRANGVANLSEAYYVWNLRVNVSQANYKTMITSVAYIKTAKGTMFFNQITTSVQEEANKMIESGDYEAYEDSLSYLATLE